MFMERTPIIEATRPIVIRIIGKLIAERGFTIRAPIAMVAITEPT